MLRICFLNWGCQTELKQLYWRKNDTYFDLVLPRVRSGVDVSLFVRIKLSNVGGSRSLSCVRLFDVLHGTSDLYKVRTLDPNQTSRCCQTNKNKHRIAGAA